MVGWIKCDRCKGVKLSDLALGSRRDSKNHRRILDLQVDELPKICRCDLTEARRLITLYGLRSPDDDYEQVDD